MTLPSATFDPCLFICPLCQSPLQIAPDTWRCDGSLSPKQTQHPFDVARQGYVNLLPVQQKKSKAPGDSQASIEARTRFLYAGHYQPLRDLITQQLDKLLAAHNETASKDKTPLRWLDIGCGEGYYNQAMAHSKINTLIAADISKPAIASMAKVAKASHQLWYQQQPDITDSFETADNLDDANKSDSLNTTNASNTSHKSAAIYPLVTSAAHLPLRAKSMIGISSIFSPILPEIFAELLQEDGYLLIAKPDVGHLAEVREALFDEVREHNSDKFLQELKPYFKLIETSYVQCDLQLAAQDLADLLTMTPYSYRARSEKRQTLLASAEAKPFITQAKFVVYTLKKSLLS